MPPMCQGQSRDHIRRMCEVAEGYLADAKALSGLTPQVSDAPYLLRLLGFEILLKATLRAHGLSPAGGHRYRTLLERLPTQVRERVLADAEARTRPGSTDAELPPPDYSNPGVLLDTFSNNFAGLRYSYEAYEELTDEQLEEQERQWVAGGSITEEATFKYYPEELFGLTEALKTEIARTVG